MSTTSNRTSNKSPGLKKKQGSLFSFFTKKSNSTPTKAKPSQSSKLTSPPPASLKKPSSSSTRESKSRLPELVIGTRVGIFWPEDDEYYPAKITGRVGNSSVCHILYDDGEKETVDMNKEEYKLLSNKIQKKRSRSDIGNGAYGNEEPGGNEDEDMADVNDDDDDSVYEEKKDETDDDDEVEDSWMVSDDDDDLPLPPPKKLKRLKVTPVHSLNKKPPAGKQMADKKEPSLPPPTQNKNRTVSPPPNTKHMAKENVTPNRLSSFSLTPPVSKPIISQSPLPPPKTPKSAPTSITPPTINTPAKTASIPPFKEGVVNPAGSHLHNHLPFLRPPHDSEQRPPSDPQYDPRTLYVNFSHITSLYKLPPAQRQWWDIKKHYFDTVLLFKTGKFYELFHMDADVGVTVCQFVYMKGVVAHSGFPEAAYGAVTDKMINAGYKVARVEQTETPDALKIRKKNTRGPKPQVVNREVCSVVSRGTRTFCYLDKSIESGACDTGPLLAIREVLLQENTDEAVCEYGIVIVDAVRSSVTLGQFADDVLRNRMRALLSSFAPSEILLEASVSTEVKGLCQTLCPGARLETVSNVERYPPSTAVDPSVRKILERPSPVHPWDSEETVSELHRCAYFPKSGKTTKGIKRWPEVLRACIDGGANLAMSAFGAGLFYLQRSLIANEILSLGNIKAYVPPGIDTPTTEEPCLSQTASKVTPVEGGSNNPTKSHVTTTHMVLDGTTLANLEIVANQHDNTAPGSLWAQINHTKTPHGSRLLRAWLLRPLFSKEDIGRRADAVSNLMYGHVRSAMDEARGYLSKVGDLERLLGRVHAMAVPEESGADPNCRAVLYEGATYARRKVDDFRKALLGLQATIRVMGCFDDANVSSEVDSGLLAKVVGSLPEGMEQELQWFFDNFDCEAAAKGQYEPIAGTCDEYDEACSDVEGILGQLEQYKQSMCDRLGNEATRAWKYANTRFEQKDKYLIELPVAIRVPTDFIVKGKRGSGAKQVNKYQTPVTANLVSQLENALERQYRAKANGMQLVFQKFTSRRSLWAAAAQATAMLDALASLASYSSQAGFTRPTVLEDGGTRMEVVQGRHPCVELTHSGDEFIPNNLSLGGNNDPRILLLSGPNMGGKSTLLRQTCLLAILTQIGSFVPAQSCSLTPIDRIFTRLGASDRILSGQSTFFVELAECATALRSATNRSLVIMDELGRGTSTFDGTALAHATVRYLVEHNRCLALFATHYHSLLEDWKSEKSVKLGHMECLVEGERVTFLYTLGTGTCPKSFGINVARLAALPEEVLGAAKRISSEFEQGLIRKQWEADMKRRIKEAVQEGNTEDVVSLWMEVKRQLTI
eukprot:CAMPEP_0172523302 /NCGR_PEP_ID=MMETSP1066-20121228/293589_1 /TAXON_ID=671091 /ORGANISM="Coscinodiscus wailesii, Strain CCMP2513" /LENGTH=1339 /DNA_ID=CAMNT_0013306373 /DNA_START=56 /DNA_END=4076 /DNA_ORIENTATION=-